MEKSMERKKDPLYRPVARAAGKAFSGCIVAVLLIYCVTLLAPILWMVLTSFKSGTLEYFENPFGLPRGLNFANYGAALRNMYVRALRNGQPVYYMVWDMMGISLLWSALSPFLGLFTTTLVAYVMAKYKFWGRNFLFMFGIFLMITPIIGGLPAAMKLNKAIGAYDNMPFRLVLSAAGTFYGFTFLMLHAAFKNISWSYAEAVFIDGGGHYTVLARIMLPMILPTFTVFYVLGFLGSWNDWSSFLIWMPNYPNLALGMYYYQQNTQTYMSTMPQIMAGFVIVCIPTLTLYLASQRLILAKLNIGGLKG